MENNGRRSLKNNYNTSDKLKNYSAYIGMTKINGKKVDLQSKRCSKEEFYDFIKKNVLKKLEGQVMIRATKSENRLRGSRIQKKQCGLKLLQKK